ncbi:MAG: hypothetical protein E7345_04645 [Clostridiales bacterium]|nr:hypothetical protein [Clostridiales bacterium]
MAGYLKLSLTILFFVFIVAGVLWGVIRGLKKTISRGLFLLITSVLLMFITIPLSKLFLMINVGFSSFTLNGVTIAGKMSINDLLFKIVEAYLGKGFAYNTVVVELMYGLVLGFTSTIIYIVLFWLFKYLFMPFNMLLNKLIFRQRTSAVSFSAFNNSDNPFDDNSGDNKNPFDDLFSETTTSEDNSNTIEETTSTPQQTSEPAVLGNIFDLAKEDTNDYPAPQEETTPTQAIDNSLFTLDVLNKQNEEAGINENDGNKERKQKKEKKQKPPKNKELRYVDNDLKKKGKHKPSGNKYRIWGGVVGAFVGIIVMMNTMVPVYGIFNTLKNAQTLTLEHISSEKPNLSSLTKGLTDDIVVEYSSSVLGAVSETIGLEAVGTAQFDTISSIKIGNNKIKVRQDINQLIKVVQEVDGLYGYYEEISVDGNLSKITQDQLDNLLIRIKSILNNCQKVKSIDTIADILIPSLCKLTTQTNLKISDNVDLNTMFHSTMTVLSEAKDINLFNEIKSIIEVLEYANSQKLLLPIISSNENDLFVNLMSVEENFTKNFIDKLYTLKTVDVAMPNIINMGLTLLSTKIDFSFERTELDKNKVHTDINNIISTLLETANSLDKNTPSLITVESLPTIGKLLNTIKSSSFLTTYTYNSLVNYGGQKLSSVLEGVLPDTLHSYVDEVVADNLTNVSNWESDLTHLKTAINTLRHKEYGIIGSVTEGSELREGLHFDDLEINENTLNNLGTALDQLEKSDLFGKSQTFNVADDTTDYTGTGVSRLVYKLLDIAKDELGKEDNEQLKTVSNTIAKMQLNILNNFVANPENKYWENEFKAISPLISELYEIKDGKDFEISKSLGVALDKASTSLLLGDDTTYSLVADMIEHIKTGAESGVDGEIDKLIGNISIRLSNPDQFTNKEHFWEIELEHIDSLMNIEFDGDIKSNLPTIGKALDNVTFGIESTDPDESLRKSYLITHEDIRTILNTAINDNKSSLTNSFDGKIKTTIETSINSIQTNIENVENYSFETELTKLQKLSNISISSDLFKFTSDTEEGKTLREQNRLAVVSIGTTLDEIAFNTNTTGIVSYAEELNSKVITRDILNDMVKGLLDNISNKSADNSPETTLETAVKDLIEDIKTNIENKKSYVFSWERELGFIHDLTKINSDMTYSLDDANSDANRNNLAVTLDALAFNMNTAKTKYEDIAYNDDKKITYLPANGNSLFITRENLIGTVAKILNTLKIDDATALSKDDIINKLLTNATETISTTTPSTHGKYNNISDSFKALDTIENSLTHHIDEATKDGVTIKDLKSEGTLDSLDQDLENYQAEPISGILVTRMIALKIINEITVPSELTSASDYRNNILVPGYTSAINNNDTNPETYCNGDPVDLNSRNNPFRTLLSTIPVI